MGRHTDRDGDGVADYATEHPYRTPDPDFLPINDSPSEPLRQARVAARSSAASVLERYGLINVDAIIQAANLEGLELAAAAACIQKESGGRNVWGSDPVLTGGTYAKGGPVTQANYLAYRTLVQRGTIGRQGVGPAQLTSSGYQTSGDALGGCWDPTANMRSGFRGLAGLIRTYGVQVGAQHYNGSGSAAVTYGRDFLARYSTWKQRLAGTSFIPVPVKRKVLPEMPERAIPAGNSGHRIVCPTGSASAVVARAWLSASFDGLATVEVWAQKAGGAMAPIGAGNDDVAHRLWTARPGDRPWFELPSGTEFVTVHVANATGPGSVAIEQLPA